MLFVGAVAVNAVAQERYDDPLSGRGSNTQPSTSEADTTTESSRPERSSVVASWQSDFCLLFKLVKI